MMEAQGVEREIYAYSFGRVAFGCGVLLLPPAQETVDPAHVVWMVQGSVSLLLHAGAVGSMCRRQALCRIVAAVVKPA